MIGTLSPDMGHTELIDTLWNVNVEVCQPFDFHFRINRYIMECKFVNMIFDDEMELLELIDTLWNVNLNENTKQMTELMN